MAELSVGSGLSYHSAGNHMCPIAKNDSDDIPVRKQWLLLLLLFLFPIFWHPWWLAVICMVLYAGLVALVLGKPKKPKDTTC